MCARSQTSPHLAARTLLAIPGLEKPLFNGVLMGFRGDPGRLGRCVKPGCSTFPLPTRQRNGHSPHTASPPRQHPRALGLAGHHEGGRTDGQTDGQMDTTPLSPSSGRGARALPSTPLPRKQQAGRHFGCKTERKVCWIVFFFLIIFFCCFIFEFARPFFWLLVQPLNSAKREPAMPWGVFANGTGGTRPGTGQVAAPTRSPPTPALANPPQRALGTRRCYGFVAWFRNRVCPRCAGETSLSAPSCRVPPHPPHAFCFFFPSSPFIFFCCFPPLLAWM